MKEKTVVLSMDALVGEDIDYLRSKPHFSRLFSSCVVVERVCTVYPSITYPAHVSILTGCRPGRHGVITNGAFKTTAGATQWHLYSDLVQVEDLFAAAKRSGCTTASVYWPVTGNNPNVDYLINEYFFPDPNEDLETGFAAQGANEETLAAIRENLHRYPTERRNRVGKLQCKHTFDDFINGCTCSLIRRYQPDLLLVHNCFVDTMRHRHGTFCQEVLESLDQMDLWLGELLQAMEDAGTLERTNFILLSDHGQLDFARRIKMNLLLREGGFVDVDEEGIVSRWRAFSQSNGMSATIFMKDPDDRQTYLQLQSYLHRLSAQGVWGFNKVYTEQEAKERYGMSGNFAFMVETDGFTAFADGWTEPVSVSADPTNYCRRQATHGYEPEKGPQPVFVAAGPAFRAGAVIKQASVLDEAPTIACILGAEMPQAEGSVLHGLLCR